MVALCVDAGTTVIKTVVYDDRGTPTGLARRLTRIDSPRPGFAEQDMDEVWAAVAATIREAAAATAEPVDMIAFTGQGDGCWLVDAGGRPTGPAILWNDARAAALADAWYADGRTEAAFRINGCLGFAGTPHAILAWLAEHDPARTERSYAALTCDGWLFHRFTGQLGMDESEAALPWLDVATREYAPAIPELFGIPGRLRPPLIREPDRMAGLSDAAAAELELAPGIPVVMAPYDLAATSIGAGAVTAGQACVILGTTLSTQVVTAEADRSGEPAGLTIPLGVDALNLRALPTLAGTQVLGWLAEVLGLADEAAIGELAAGVPAGAGGLFFLPYLSPAGERAPFLDAAARGSFAGLSLGHGRPQLARAVLEGLTYVIRECLTATGVRPSELRVCGGGANSAPWCRLIADVTGAPVLRSADDEVGARGAYCHALVVTGRVPDHAAAVAEHVRNRDAFHPDPARHARYSELYDDFLALRADAAAGWPRLAAARQRGQA